MVGTAALIIVLSVFNGFEGLIVSLFNSFNPDISITAAEGKTFNSSDFPTEEIKKIPGVVYYTEVIEENALLRYKSQQFIATIKGVSSDFASMTKLNEHIIDGEFILDQNGVEYGVFGAEIAYRLGINLNDFTTSVDVYIPRRTSTISLNFASTFNQQSIIPVGVFAVQQEFDSKYAIVPIEFARRILEYENELTGVEIGLKPGSSSKDIILTLTNLLGKQFVVKDRFQQQEFLYKVMKSEKLAIFIILSFIIVIAIINVIGSITMLILDKRKDILILTNLGAENQTIKKIFLIEGMIINFSGAILGLILGGLFCWLQTEFGLITIGAGASFVVEAYPVKMKLLDFLLVMGTVFFIGTISAWLPVRRINKKYFSNNRF